MKKSAKKRNLHYNLLIIFSVILIALIISWVFIGIIYEKRAIQYKDEEILGTAGVFGSDISQIEYYEVLNVSYYIILNNSIQIMLMRLPGSSGNINGVLVVFNRNQENCSYNIISPLPTITMPAIYNIDVTQTNCGSNFIGVFQVLAYGINITTINLTQINNIPNLDMQIYEYRTNVINLNNYFANLSSGDPDLDLVPSISILGVQLTKSSDFLTSREINVNVSIGFPTIAIANITLIYPWINPVVSNNFNISIAINNCNDSDGGRNYSLKGTAMNLSANGSDRCYNATYLQEYYCDSTIVTSYNNTCSTGCNDGACIRDVSENIPPEFISNNCNLTGVDWYKNENSSLNVSNCFRDPDGDSLVYKFFLFDDSPLTIIQNGSWLKLIPKLNWFGNGSFYAYANDSINETSGIVYFSIKDSGLIVNRTIDQTINQSIINETLRIRDPIPNGSVVTKFLGDNLTFFVSNTVYDSLEWYLDKKSLKNNSNTFEVIGLSKGNHSVEVKIRKDARVVSKIWKVIIEGDEKGRKFIFNAGWLMFYLILVVATIIIILVIWLFIEESRNKKVNLNMGIINGAKTYNNLFKKEDMSKKFNIPK